MIEVKEGVLFVVLATVCKKVILEWQPGKMGEQAMLPPERAQGKARVKVLR